MKWDTEDLFYTRSPQQLANFDRFRYHITLDCIFGQMIKFRTSVFVRNKMANLSGGRCKWCYQSIEFNVDFGFYLKEKFGNFTLPSVYFCHSHDSKIYGTDSFNWLHSFESQLKLKWKCGSYRVIILSLFFSLFNHIKSNIRGNLLHLSNFGGNLWIGNINPQNLQSQSI